MNLQMLLLHKYFAEPPICLDFGLRFVQVKSPRVNLKSAGEHAFHFAAAAVWNSLPNSLRNIHSLPQFKKQLKTHLFLQTFLD